MRVLLSIKPEYAKKILDGYKKYEYRKYIFRKYSIKTIVMYATSPVCKVVGEFSVDHILKLAPSILWGITNEFGGISKELFDKYFMNTKIGYGICIGEVKQYHNMLDIKKYYGVTPPQSFTYILG